MKTMHGLAEIITDCALAALALYAAYRIIRYCYTTWTVRDIITVVDPVDTQIWAVLAEARTITEQAVKDDDAAR